MNIIKIKDVTININKISYISKHNYKYNNAVIINDEEYQTIISNNSNKMPSLYICINDNILEFTFYNEEGIKERDALYDKIYKLMEEN